MRRKLLWLTVRGPFKRPSARRIVFSITLAMPCSFISLKIGIHQTNKDINTLIIVHVHMVLGFQAAKDLGDFSFDSYCHATVPFEFGKRSSCVPRRVNFFSRPWLRQYESRERRESHTFSATCWFEHESLHLIFVFGCVALQLFVRSNATIIGNG